MKIGFIGLGNMGAPMAANLAKAGHEVTGFDPAAAAPEGVDARRLRGRGGHGRRGGHHHAAQRRDPARRRGRDHPGDAPGAVLLDCSTVDVDSARAVAEAPRRPGCGALDAPVSGGIGGADGGHADLHGRRHATRPSPRRSRSSTSWAQKAVHCGPAGNGQAAKICNNMILGVTMIATCEAFALADKLGLDRQAMFDVVSTSSGYCWSMNAYCPAPGIGPKSPADNGYKPGFAADLMLKDLRLPPAGGRGGRTPTRRWAPRRRDLYASFVEDEDGTRPRLLGHAAPVRKTRAELTPRPKPPREEPRTTRFHLADKLRGVRGAEPPGGSARRRRGETGTGRARIRSRTCRAGRPARPTARRARCRGRCPS